MAYCAYVIEHFPYMEEENPYLADRFADTIDYTCEYCNRLKLSVMNSDLKYLMYLMNG